MGLSFLVREGERAGDQFRIQGGLVIGRAKADISLRDPKVSTVHARIEEDPAKRLFLVDAGSSNGLWVDEKKLERLELKKGVVVRIGSTVLLVLDDFELDLPEEDRDTWRGKLLGYFKGLATKSSYPPPLAPKMFTFPLALEFIEGPQMGEVWTLGYGPRKVGRTSFDLPVLDMKGPETLFELLPDPEGVVYRTEFPDLVNLNHGGLRSELLKDGDVIRFGTSAIRVIYKNPA